MDGMHGRKRQMKEEKERKRGLGSPHPQLTFGGVRGWLRSLTLPIIACVAGHSLFSVAGAVRTAEYPSCLHHYLVLSITKENSAEDMLVQAS